MCSWFPLPCVVLVLSLFSPMVLERFWVMFSEICRFAPDNCLLLPPGSEGGKGGGRWGEGPAAFGATNDLPLPLSPFPPSIAKLLLVAASAEQQLRN